MRTQPDLTAELEIMKVVWRAARHRPRRLRALLEERKVAYTHVMTMMNVLERKGHLRKRARGAPSSTAPPAPAPGGRLDGAGVRRARLPAAPAAPLLAHLVERGEAHARELDALARRSRREISALELVLRNPPPGGLQVGLLALAAAAALAARPIDRPGHAPRLGQSLLALVVALPLLSRGAVGSEVAWSLGFVAPDHRPAPATGAPTPPTPSPGPRRRRRPPAGVAFRFWRLGTALSGCGRCAAGPAARRAAWLRRPRARAALPAGVFLLAGGGLAGDVRPPPPGRPAALASRPSRGAAGGDGPARARPRRRRDWLFVLLEELLRAVLFFHRVHWLVGRVRLAEADGDAAVVGRLGARDAYLDSLVDAARLAPEPARSRPRPSSGEPPPGAGGLS